MESLSNKRFYSFLMDGTTDAGNVEDELIVTMSFHKDDAAGELGSFARYFSIEVADQICGWSDICQTKFFIIHTGLSPYS